VPVLQLLNLATFRFQSPIALKMAIGGGGSGGGPVGVGNSFVGPQEALEIAGNFAYAYNQVGSDLLQTPTATLVFTSGNYLFVGHWTVSGSVNKDGVSTTGGVDQFYFKLNGSTVMSIKSDTNDEESPTVYTVPVIIPAYTEVECLANCTLNNANWVVSNSLTGRIYRD